jgi:nucleoid-associated protein YgaU
MAIFEFVKGAGQVLSSGLEAASEAVRAEAEKKAIEAVTERIKASKIPHRDLALKFTSPGCLKVYVVVESLDAKDDIILMAGNTAGVEKVEDAIKVRPPGATADVTGPPPRLYTVKAGDSLSAIARSQLGDENRYREIFEANRHILSNPDQLEIGQTLKLPK